MKKSFYVILSLFLLASCQKKPSYPAISSPNSSSSIESSSSSSSSDTSSSDSSSNNSNLSSSSSSSIQTTLSAKTINEVLNIGRTLDEGQRGEQVMFTGVYVKMINFNFDHYMLFVDDNDYIYVYVNNSNYNKVNNKYLKYSYTVTGTIQKERSNVIVNYESITNLSSGEVTINYDNLVDKMDSIASINEEASKIILDEKKYNGSGKIVSFDGQIIAFDESDANQKVVVYDGDQVITVIHTKTIASKTDIGSIYTFIGVINIESSHPAILLIDKTLKESNQEIIIKKSEQVSASYFSKWNLNSSVMNIPSYNDYAKIYTSTVYIKDDSSKTNAYYLGMVDNIDDSLSDSGMTSQNVVKGAYLMNNLNLTERELTNYSPFYDYYVSKTPVMFSYVLFNFNNSDHIWRVMPLSFTIPEYN